MKVKGVVKDFGERVSGKPKVFCFKNSPRPKRVFLACYSKGQEQDGNERI